MISLKDWRIFALPIGYRKSICPL